MDDKLNSNVDAIEDLVASGDIKLSEERSKFQRVVGRETTLTDAELIEAIAMTTDDDEQLFAQNVRHIEERAK